MAFTSLIFCVSDARAQVSIGGSTCATSNLNGTYFYLLTGTIVEAGEFLPYAELGKIVANGNGSFSGQSQASIAGVQGAYSLSGTYSVQGTCEGTMNSTVTSASGQTSGTLTFQVVSGGQGANLAVSTSGEVVAGRAYRQTATAAASTQCSSGSLSGSYGYLLSGVRISGNTEFLYADDGQVISDGAGHLSASSVANLNGVATGTTGTGSYTVASDCSGTAHITNANGTLDYVLAVVQDGQSALFLGSDTGYVIAGTGQPQFTSPQAAIVNAASFAPESLSPGSLFSIFGANLSQQIASAKALPCRTPLLRHKSW